ncbi:hypothetical protein HaLaN_23354 [Haematococcus lacustris]|uniref:Uncharacterized protein n=1 Tax=Haematococcus lacustris TaxID=44745 RepID=A0A6A0A4D5_HAELA|nr:hypothetical protein HaLaN_23354 [Haematococcus lacustris]
MAYGTFRQTDLTWSCMDPFGCIFTSLQHDSWLGDNKLALLPLAGVVARMKRAKQVKAQQVQASSNFAGKQQLCRQDCTLAVSSAVYKLVAPQC